jgi:hypothetical protein
MRTILLLIVILLLLGGAGWGYTAGWGYGGPSVLGLIVLVLLALLLTGRL